MGEEAPLTKKILAPIRLAFKFSGVLALFCLWFFAFNISENTSFYLSMLFPVVAVLGITSSFYLMCESKKLKFSLTLFLSLLVGAVLSVVFIAVWVYIGITFFSLRICC